MAGSIVAHPGLAGTIGLGLAIGGAVGFGLQAQRRIDEDRGYADLAKQYPGYHMPSNVHDRETEQLWLTGGGTALAIAGGLAAAFTHNPGLRIGGAAAMGVGALMYGGATLLEGTMGSAGRDDANDIKLQSYERGDVARPGTAGGGDPATVKPPDRSIKHVGQILFDAVDRNHDKTFDQADVDAGGSVARGLYSMAGSAATDVSGFTDKVVKPLDYSGDGNIDSGELVSLARRVADETAITTTVPVGSGDPWNSGNPTTTGPVSGATVPGGTVGAGGPGSAPPGGWSSGQPTTTYGRPDTTYGQDPYAAADPWAGQGVQGSGNYVDNGSGQQLPY